MEESEDGYMLQKLDRTKNTARNFVWGLINKVTTLLLPFLIRAVIIRVLGKEYLGLNNLFSSILSVLNLAELGIGSAMVYAMYKPIAENDCEEICSLLSLYRTIYRYIGIIVAVMGVILIPFLPKLINGNTVGINVVVLYLIFLSDTVLSYWLYAYKTSLLSAYQRVDIISNIGTAIQFSLNGIQILALLITKNYYAYIIFKPIFTVINNLIIKINTDRLFPALQPVGNASNAIVKDVFSRVKALVGHKIGATVIASADSLVISSFLGLGVLSIYSNYYYIIFFLISVSSIFFNGMLAGIGNSLVTESTDHNYNLFENINFITNWFVMWCSACLLSLLQPFMTLWMGKNMLLSFDSLILIVVYYYTWQFRTTGLFFKDAAGMWKDDFYKPYVAAIVNIILNIVLVKSIGINGVFISTIFCMLFIYFPWETYVLFRNLFKRPMKNYIRQQFVYIIETIIIVISTYCTCELITAQGFWELLFKAVVCVLLPNIMFAGFNCKTKGFKYCISKGKTLLNRGTSQ